MRNLQVLHDCRPAEAEGIGEFHLGQPSAQQQEDSAPILARFVKGLNNEDGTANRGRRRH
jgi:hypothetical protein